jgi:NitT/TauT family transport system permease protein
MSNDNPLAETKVQHDDLALAGDHYDNFDATATKRKQRRTLIVGRIAVVVIGLIAWDLLSGNVVRTFYLPKPLAVLGELEDWISDGSIFIHIMATLVPAAEGFLIATVAALGLGYMLAMARSTAGIIEPFIAGIYGVPIIALVPLMILWFGIGQELAVATATLASFFLMFYNAYFGIREVSQSLIDQVAIAGGSKWDIAVRVRLPSALVWLVAGMKVAVPHSLVGVVVAEFLTGSKGLGFLLANNANQFDAAGTFAAVTTLAAISFVVDRLMNVLTKRPLMWKEATRH